MQQMQPMQQQPMQQPQMQQPPRPKPAKQGTSRAVPVVVSAGLAVGVFCGLLFGVGVPDTTASPSTGNNVKASEPEKEPTPKPSTSSTATKPATTATTAKPATPLPAAGTNTGAGSATTAAATPAAGSGSTTTAAATPAAGSGSTTTTTTTAAATPAAGSGSTTTTKPGAGSAAAVVVAPVAKKVKVVIEVKPELIAGTAKITVDKADVTGGTMEMELPATGKKEVKVVVKATGYKTFEQKVDIEGDVTTVKVELVKRPTSSGGGLQRPPTGGGGTGKKKPAGGGLIDI